MFGLIKNCFKYARSLPRLKIIEEGDILDVLELKLEIMRVKYENKGTLSNEEIEKQGTVILLLDKVKKYKNSESKSADQKIEITKMFFELM